MPLRDLIFAGRILRKSPIFALTAALTIALGIGASTAIFSVTNAVDEGYTARAEEIWAAGDCVRGADLIVTAMAPARKAACSIDRALRARLTHREQSESQEPSPESSPIKF